MNIKSLFDKAAQGYDQARRQLVPCFKDFYGTALDLIPFERDAAIRVLDLGAGTGLLSALVAETFPRAHLTLVDISEGMLDQGRRLDRWRSESRDQEGRDLPVGARSRSRSGLRSPLTGCSDS